MIVLNLYFEQEARIFIPVVDSIKVKDIVFKIYKNIYEKLIEWHSTTC